jgi:tetratricopeptide (TPR) repeat protein
MRTRYRLILAGLFVAAVSYGESTVTCAEDSPLLEFKSPEAAFQFAGTLESTSAACESQGSLSQAASLFTHLGRLYDHLGRYKQAEQSYKHALRLSESTEEPGTNTVAILANLADVYRVQRKDAGPLYSRALAIAEKAYGPDDQRVATILNNYALFEKGRGRPEPAEKLFHRALEIRQCTSGPNDPETATVLNNLGQVAMLRGDRAKARALFRRAIHIWEKTLGPEHPNVASGLSNLATAFSSGKKYRDAEPLFRRALSIDTARYGYANISTGRDLNNLGVLCFTTRRYNEAEPLFAKALEVHRRTAPVSPETAKVIRNLAEVRTSLGAPQDAEALYKEALAMWGASNNPNDPESLPAVEALIALCRKSQRYAEAEKLELRAMRIRVKQALAAEQRAKSPVDTAGLN